MEKIKRLGRYQKGILLLMIVMILAFIVVYSATIAKEGFAYQDTILIQNEVNGTITYSGKIQGKQATFTVPPDKTVTFQYGDTVYGPYTAKEDATAIPKDIDFGDSMTGIELFNGEKIIFRGGVMKAGDDWWIYNEDGSFTHTNLSFTTGDGIETDENGNVIDPMEPSISTILDLMNGPKLTHKGDWLAWFYGAFVCVITAISIIFADELFRFNLAFQIRNVDRAEPSDWEIAGRYISWTLLPILAMVMFIVGLQ